MQLTDRTELGLLADTVDEMAAEIKASQESMLDRERLSHEMNLAHAIQQSLMPDAQLRRGTFTVDGFYEAATEVGGDYFDIFELPESQIGFFIADVAGKGLGGCLVTSMLAALLKAHRDRHTVPSELLKALDRDLHGFLRPGIFVTAAYGILTSGRTVCNSPPRLIVLYTWPAAPRNRRGALHARRAHGHHGARRLFGFDSRRRGQTEPRRRCPALHRRLERSASRRRWGRVRRREDHRVLEASCRFGAPLHDGVPARRGVGLAGDGVRSDDLTLLAVGCAPLTEALEVSSMDGSCFGQAQSLDIVVDGVYQEEDLQNLTGNAQALSVGPKIEDLSVIPEWLHSLDNDFVRRNSALLEGALYEYAANVLEHGFVGRAAGKVEFWIWDSKVDHPLAGCILARDRGRACSPYSVAIPDLDDPEVRMLGRGLAGVSSRT